MPGAALPEYNRPLHDCFYEFLHDSMILLNIVIMHAIACARAALTSTPCNSNPASRCHCVTVVTPGSMNDATLLDGYCKA
jgi:hypothetical protein